MKIGYARVSTQDQNLDLQINALKEAGCDEIVVDHGLSGRGFERPGLREALEMIRDGDKLIVWRLDRLGRSLPNLIQFVDELGKRNAQFHSLNECIDTSSSGGRLVFHIMGALAEFERTLISERTRAGMEAARRRGSKIGRRPSLSFDQIQQIIAAIKKGATPLCLASRYGITPRTLKRYLKAAAAYP